MVTRLEANSQSALSDRSSAEPLKGDLLAESWPLNAVSFL
jgi:hypothetical protein